MSRRSKGKSPQGAASSARLASTTSQGGIPADASRNRWRSLGICVLLGLAVWAVFGQTLHFGFINYDDNLNVYENALVSKGLSAKAVVWAFTHSPGANWNPLTTLSHMLDCQLYDLQPARHHLTNVVLHGANVMLLFLLLRSMTGAVWRSAFAAAVFAIHPLRAESVAWLAERKDVLSGLFFMLTLFAYARYVGKSKIGGPKSKVWYALALLCFALGLLSKPTLVTVPFVLLLLDYWPLNRLPSLPPGDSRALLREWFRLIPEKIPFLLLSAIDCAATLLAQRVALVSGQQLDFPARLGNALVAYVDYLGKMVYPTRLAALYPLPANQPSVGLMMALFFVLCVISAGVAVGQRKHRYLLVGWLWYLGMLVPVSGLVQSGPQARADRFTYLPQIGLYLLVAWGAVELCGGWRWRRVALGSAAAAILAGLLTVAREQTAYWKDSVTLWTHTLACTSDNIVALNDLGTALVARGDTAEAIPRFEQALQLEPDYVEAQYNLGNALAGSGKLSEALPHFERAVQLHPENAGLQNNLGNALAGLGRVDEATAHFEAAVRLNPDYPEARNNLGVALTSRGKPAEAVPHFEKALELKTDYAEARYNLGNALAGLDKEPEAIQQYEQALQLRPDYAEAECNLADALVVVGKTAEAAGHYQQALDLAIAQHKTLLAEAIRRRMNTHPSALPEPQKP